MSSTMTAPTMERATDLWFDDGTLILQVETTQFKVHRGVLCAHSMVFRDMHSVPQPAESGTQDGCPVVVLKDDSATDWMNLLGYIYFHAKVTNTTSGLDFPRVASFMRLGRKYVFEDIYTFASRIIRAHVPGNRLSEWDNPSTIEAKRKWTKDHEFDLLNLASEHDMVDILPIVYYLCMLDHTLVELLRGKIRTDGSTSTIHSDALATLLIGREKVHDRVREILTTSMSFYLPECIYKKNEPDSGKTSRVLSQCEVARMAFFERLSLFDPRTHAQNLCAPTDPHSKLYAGFCKECIAPVVAYQDRRRRLLFRNLPYYFDLPDWDQGMMDD